jgi:HEAT repeat protein
MPHRSSALCNLGERKEAIPVLIEALKSKNDMLSDWAATMMGLIGPDGRAALPSLIEALKDTKHRVRAAAAKALYYMGTEAKEAVPALIETRHDQNATVRSKAAEALRRIDPGAPARQNTR